VRPIVKTGLHLLLERGHEAVNGRRIGLVTNHTAVDATLRSAVDLLYRDDRFDLVHLYGPEHGVRGAAQAGDHVGAETDPDTSLPVDSLYGKTRKPTPEMLEGVEVLLFDIQDAGARFYTYISTMVLAMEAASEQGIPFVVLDRPNPITGLRAEGTILEPNFESFVGIHPIPTKHALTMGELARLVAREKGLPEPIVIAMEGWRREMWWDETGLPFVPPSPNLPTLDSLTLYPGTCIFEGTTMSEGRGTTRPFEFIGAPWVNATELVEDLRSRNLPGIGFRPASFVPSFSKHQGETCHGVQVHITDRESLRPVALGVHLIHAFAHLSNSGFAWRPGGALGMSSELLYGNSDLHTMIDAGATPEEIIARWDGPLAGFAERAKAVSLYE
jgi:uncharacterized protein YbbC (DUF1343 family)